MPSFFDRHRGTLLALFTIAAVAGMIWLDSRPRGGLSTGSEAPNFELSVLDSEETVNLEALRGQPVVLDFFATWCRPCKLSLPELDTIAAEYAGRAHVFAVNAENESLEAQRAFRDGLRLKMPVLPAGSRVAGAYKVEMMPTTVVLGRDGTVARTFVGPPPSSTLKALLDSL